MGPGGTTGKSDSDIGSTGGKGSFSLWTAMMSNACTASFLLCAAPAPSLAGYGPKLHMTSSVQFLGSGSCLFSPEGVAWWLHLGHSTVCVFEVLIGQ